MNRQEIAEIRRRMNPGKNAVSRVRGCYVNQKKEIVATFDRSLMSFPQEEVKNYGWRLVTHYRRAVTKIVSEKNKRQEGNNESNSKIESMCY